MNIEIHRLTWTAKSTQGLLAIDGMSKFTTLEPPAGGDGNGNELPIPEGKYHVVKRYSPKFKRDTPHLLDVPGHTFIEIHMGNAPEDTEGCILVGKTRADDWIGSSRQAFEDFMAMTPNEFDLTIFDNHGNGDQPDDNPQSA